MTPDGQTSAYQANEDISQTPEFRKMQQILQEALNRFRNYLGQQRRDKESLQKDKEDLRNNWLKTIEEKKELQEEIGKLKKALDEKKNEIDAIRKDNEALKQQNKKSPANINSGVSSFQSAMNNPQDNVLRSFNQWASIPNQKLPVCFRYLEGDFKIKFSNTIKECASPSKWISNRTEGTKYLFPNPNTFNEVTNISELYETTAGSLKAKGQNRIKILKPCVMSEQGFIEFPGELQLL